MKKIIAFLGLILLLISFTSAEIIINQQPKNIYNLGDSVSFPVTVKTLTDITSVFEMNLICQGHELNFYKNGVSLSAGGEKNIDASLILTKNLIDDMRGDCIIKAILGNDYVLTNQFKISDSINANVQIKTSEINPGEQLIINGGAIEESGKNVNGFAQIEINPQTGPGNTQPITQLASVNNGFFNANISTPDDLAAGAYTVKINVYERDNTNEITNQGYTDTTITIKQLAKNLEIVIDNANVEPGTSVKAKAVLHDQTGQNIDSTAIIKIKDSNNKLLDSLNTSTDEVFEYPIKYNEPPANFTITGESAGITAQAYFNIQEKADIKIQITNQTLSVLNTGNVPYCNKTILVKIGNQSLDLAPCLDIDQQMQYELTAPDGEYQVEVITDNQKISESVALTGKAIDIKQASQSIASLSRHPFIWFFVIGIVGFLAVTVFRKGYKRIIIGRTFRKEGQKSSEPIKSSGLKKVVPLIETNKAELSLSMKGDEQSASVVCLRLKNFREIQSNTEGVKDILNKVTQIAKDHKALIYQNEGNFFFILAPIKTKTFKNEKTAVDMTIKIKDALIYHNKFFKQKIDFGLALESGEIVANAGKDKFEFMSRGTLMINLKKIVAISKGEMLLGEKIKDKLGAEIKTERATHEGMPVYRITEIKDRKENEKFIKSFLNRVEK
jgi:hypothetical protein